MTSFSWLFMILKHHKSLLYDVLLTLLYSIFFYLKTDTKTRIVHTLGDFVMFIRISSTFNTCFMTSSKFWSLTEIGF
jgi:hypothetical protein